MIKISKYKKIILRCLSVIIIFFSILFSYTWKNGYNLGDRLLTSIGLKPWSNGVHGTHYTVMYSLVMMLVAFFIYTITTEKKLMTLLYFICGFLILFFVANILF